jgi:hypothetical protein
MSSSDVIALVSVAIAIGALGVAYKGWRQQVSKDQNDAAQELADRINAIQEQMGKLGVPAASSRPIDMIATTNNVTASLRALVLRAAALIESAGLEPNWYQAAVLAGGFLQIADLAGANKYTGLAVKKAKDDDSLKGSPTAVVVSLSLRAAFFFNRGFPGDAESARQTYEDARNEVETHREGQGPFVSAGHMIELYVRQAGWELASGEIPRAAALVAQAADVWSPITALAVKLSCGGLIDTFARNQPFAAPETLLPESFVAEFAEFQRQHGAPADYGWLTSPGTGAPLLQAGQLRHGG